MKIISHLALAAVCLSFCGCAGLNANNSVETVVDQEKIDTVNAWAKRNNTQVIWVSSPTRRADVVPAVMVAPTTSISPVLR
jgi:uncharacterized membrane protein